MSKGKKTKKKKNKWKMPPLSLLDQGIYLALSILGVFFCGFLFFGRLILRDRIAFADPQVVANGDGMGGVWFLPLLTYAAMEYFVSPQQKAQARQPLFGKKGVKYGPPQWPPVYPRFSRDYPKPERTARLSVRLVSWLLAQLLPLVLLLLLALPSVCSRTCLNTDGSIRVYNAFNRETEFHAAEQMEAVSISTNSSRHGPKNTNVTWTIRLTLTDETGDAHFFYYRDMRGGLSNLIQIKSCYDPEIIQIRGTGQLDKVIEEYHFNEEECQLLYQLFEVD